MTSKTSNSLTLDWQPPPTSERNGIIQFYTIALYEIETDNSLEFISNSSNASLSSLHPYYHYECRVRAETILPGPYSISITIQLDEDGMHKSLSCIV